jgi:phospholipid transport system substrate-binding protein
MSGQGHAGRGVERGANLMVQMTRRMLGMALLVLPAVRTSAASTEDGGAFIDLLGRRTIEVLDRVGSDPEKRRQAISQLLDETVDLTLIARLCLGRHWRSASDAQRAEYVALFRANVLATLSRRMNYYTGSERFVVTSSQPAGEDTMVTSEVVYATNDPPLKIGWRVRTSGAKPTIIDVLPEGVSLVLTYRSEFDEVVGRGGMDGLLSELRARAAAKAKA